MGGITVAASGGMPTSFFLNALIVSSMSSAGAAPGLPPRALKC
jgi:hypothetical protein